MWIRHVERNRHGPLGQAVTLSDCRLDHSGQCAFNSTCRTGPQEGCAPRAQTQRHQTGDQRDGTKKPLRNGLLGRPIPPNSQVVGSFRSKEKICKAGTWDIHLREDLLYLPPTSRLCHRSDQDRTSHLAWSFCDAFAGSQNQSMPRQQGYDAGSPWQCCATAMRTHTKGGVQAFPFLKMEGSWLNYSWEHSSLGWPLL